MDTDMLNPIHESVRYSGLRHGIEYDRVANICRLGVELPTGSDNSVTNFVSLN